MADAADCNDGPPVPNFPIPSGDWKMKNQDLLSRVSSFLPQIQAANQALDDEDADDRRVDDDLAVAEEDDDSPDDSSGSDEEKEHAVNEKDVKPQHATIQFQLAVGKVDENPAIKWLAADGSDEKGASDGDDEEEDGEKGSIPESATEAEISISNLLGKRKRSSIAAPKKPLITELS